MKITVAIAGTAGLPARYGGFETLAEQLVRYNKCNESEVSYIVYCDSKCEELKSDEVPEATLVKISLPANGIFSVLYDAFCLLHAALIGKPDIVLLLGVSGGVILPIFKKLSRVPVISNIDGVEWRRDKWGGVAKAFLRLSESLAVKYSDAIVADNCAILELIPSQYAFKTHHIAYGGDHAQRKESSTTDDYIQAHLPCAGQKYGMSVCRIEPENNVSMILEAFLVSDLNLIFVGNWESSDYGRGLRTQFSTNARFRLLDPIYDLDELFALRRCATYYIHGHSAGGTNPSLVEMMFFDVPIFAYDCVFNRYTLGGAGFYFGSVDELVGLLENNLECKQVSANVAGAMSYAHEHYTWKKIGAGYSDLFRDVLLSN